ncbi:sensor histidine kinase [Ruegeria arenilitoris]|uniref:sensor histidine kinase n=1 Tax=Ruegeria arenilitoris TaxID=1173585 RepID=UPI001480B4D9|nr:HAMP domain-containing sensor histidine kinase [Ruegeria arenilitoris]
MKMSLSLRLLLAAALTTTLALAATAIVFNILFRLYFEHRARGELETYLTLLSGNVSVDEEGSVEVAPISDPRFEQPVSGYYWQVLVDDGEPILSPSFWAAPLMLDRPQTPGVISFDDVTTDSGETVAVASWVITLGESEIRREIFLAVAIDRADLDVSVSRFTTNSIIWLAVLGLFLLAASWIQVRLGLNPLQKVRSEVSRISRYPDQRLSSDYPTEVLPLVKEVNQLLDANAEALERARSRAGNLAHGLKTPLTIMHGVERKMRKSGHNGLADDLMTEITAIQHIVERELASSRDSQQVLRRADASAIVARLQRTFGRQPGAEHLHWITDLPETLHLPFDEFDLTELMGNLLDNAVKWSKSRIIVSGGQDGTTAILTIEDDGPGIPDSEHESVLKRGRRLDPDQPGSGLGLNIAQRMARAHGCDLSLDQSALGGLKVCLTWSSAHPTNSV